MSWPGLLLCPSGAANWILTGGTACKYPSLSQLYSTKEFLEFSCNSFTPLTYEWDKFELTMKSKNLHLKKQEEKKEKKEAILSKEDCHCWKIVGRTLILESEGQGLGSSFDIHSTSCETTEKFSRLSEPQISQVCKLVIKTYTLSKVMAKIKIFNACIFKIQ